MIDYFPIALAFLVVFVALLTFWIAYRSNDYGRRSLAEVVKTLSERVAALEEEDAAKWEKIRQLERTLVRREALLRRVYEGSLILYNQLSELGHKPAYTPPEQISDHFEVPNRGIDTRLADLVRLIDQHFSGEELRSMCLDLRIDYDNLRGATKKAKITSLVTHFERRGRVEEVLEYCLEQRPGVYGWPII